MYLNIFIYKLILFIKFYPHLELIVKVYEYHKFLYLAFHCKYQKFLNKFLFYLLNLLNLGRHLTFLHINSYNRLCKFKEYFVENKYFNLLRPFIAYYIHS